MCFSVRIVRYMSQCFYMLALTRQYFIIAANNRSNSVVLQYHYPLGLSTDATKVLTNRQPSGCIARRQTSTRFNNTNCGRKLKCIQFAFHLTLHVLKNIFISLVAVDSCVDKESVK